MGDRILRRYFAAAILFALFTGQADARPYQEMFPDRSDFSEAEKPLLEKLDFQQGAIKLPEAKATLNVPQGFYYLNSADTKKVLVDIWGNPAAAAEGKMGMIFPAKYAPTDIEAWGSVVEYSADGYVSDADAATTNTTNCCRTSRIPSEKTTSSAKSRVSRRSRLSAGPRHRITTNRRMRCTGRAIWSSAMMHRGSTR